METPPLPPAAWGRVWRRTLATMAISAIGSLVLAQVLMLTLSQGLDAAGATASVILPLLLGGPMLFYMQLRSQQLSEANRRLEALASTDWLTDCLNRRVFTNEVDAVLQARAPGHNALLVVDADHFKAINDRFGHHRGDEVLRLIADGIKANVRDSDFVGRLGGEEFGIFLRDVDESVAKRTAERIREHINALSVQSDGFSQRLSVSIGGAAAQGRLTFAELFRTADRRLYEAKRNGRNQHLFGEPVGDGDSAAIG
ncbi:MAG: GGDEF domain-containing protein [Devosia sp.]|nr:GGDEF domain-containing protein [Devosia sp.]